MSSGSMGFGSSEGRLILNSTCASPAEVVIRGTSKVINNSDIVPNMEDKGYVGSEITEVLTAYKAMKSTQFIPPVF